MSIEFRQIGIIRSGFQSRTDMPIQAKLSDMPGRVILDEDYVEALDGLQQFSHIILIYHFHESGAAKLKVVPFLDTEARGVFATRAPVRPNNIGLSVVELSGIKGNCIHVKNVDILDQTPLLDIKPYVPKFDIFDRATNGWLAGKPGIDVKSDDRFSR